MADKPQQTLPMPTTRKTRKPRYNDEGPARTVGGRITYAGIDKWEDLALRQKFHGDKP